MAIRCRYAPSPTGYFHVGGARTALFNYLFAKHNKGTFIVRIEDTDVSRNVEGGIESQLENLKWLGIDVDESVLYPGYFGPYIQSKKFEIYKKLAFDLVNQGKAYYCFCSEERLQQDRDESLKNHETPRYKRHCLHLSQSEVQKKLKKGIPSVIRLKIDDNKEYAWNDSIRGPITVPGSAMTDPVILKSNGIAMYNFAVVVDDYDMQITHVLRGEEHISNTPYQLAITEALGHEPTISYGHLSVIVDETGKKLSKRNKDLKQFIEDYRLMGYLPEAVFNFLSLLGWSDKNNEEIEDKQTIINHFDIDSVSKSPSFFDIKKMDWIGNAYFKKMDDAKYIDFVKPFINSKNPVLDNNQDMVLMMFKSSISYATQINDLIKENFGCLENDFIIPENWKENFNENSKTVIRALSEKLSSLENWDEAEIKDTINKIGKEIGVKGKDLFMPIRLAVSYSSHGPELAKTIYLIGKENSIKNIESVLN